MTPDLDQDVHRAERKPDHALEDLHASRKPELGQDVYRASKPDPGQVDHRATAKPDQVHGLDTPKPVPDLEEQHHHIHHLQPELEEVQYRIRHAGPNLEVGLHHIHHASSVHQDNAQCYRPQRDPDHEARSIQNPHSSSQTFEVVVEQLLYPVQTSKTELLVLTTVASLH